MEDILKKIIPMDKISKLKDQRFSTTERAFVCTFEGFDKLLNLCLLLRKIVLCHHRQHVYPFLPMYREATHPPIQYSFSMISLDQTKLLKYDFECKKCTSKQ